MAMAHGVNSGFILSCVLLYHLIRKGEALVNILASLHLFLISLYTSKYVFSGYIYILIPTALHAQLIRLQSGLIQSHCSCTWYLTCCQCSRFETRGNRSIVGKIKFPHRTPCIRPLEGPQVFI